MKKNIFIGILGTAIILAIFLGVNNSNKDFSKKKVPGEKHIAIIRVEGLIAGGTEASMFGAVASSEKIMKDLREAAADPQTGAILIRINSPGGSAPASQEIGEEIKKIRIENKLPVITSMGDVAASGGYWIACTTDHIIANPSTMTGSIGVIMETQNWSELYNKIGVKPKSIKSGPHKDMGSTSRDLSVEEEQILQGMVNDIYEQFITVVSDGRKISREQARELADGRIFTGRQAKDLKLVDRLGNYYDAIDYTQETAGLTGEPMIKEYGSPSPWDIFKVQIQSPLQENALLKLVNSLLMTTEVQY